MQDVEYDDSDSGFQPSDSQAPASSSTHVKEICSVSSSIAKNKWRPLDPAVETICQQAVTKFCTSCLGTCKQNAMEDETADSIGQVDFTVNNSRYVAFSFAYLTSCLYPTRISKSLDTVTVPRLQTKLVVSITRIYLLIIFTGTGNGLNKTNGNAVEKEKQLLKEESEFLKSLQSAKKSVDSRNRSLQRSKLHPLFKEVEDPDDLVDVDNDLIKQYLTHVTTDVPLTVMNAHTSIIDPVIDGVYEDERQIWRLMNESGLGEKVFDVLRDC
ncbi:3883_t:CDS:2 [Paraglomus occultum]|uniref:3883_t:CDS:1 n=1 Tax=Paraglomus occultum TaxID=144539 RepID=A0A9N9CY59_9GLOM|nr:3883_t:CDS:2 [Paraglomus occultum]